ncbi:hypothetical protein H920_05998 [Fukomys damarensis]|uniref:Uncharacterized protein n=1 Tax=Fukomys damarensis TaxID=885580 RepID=A0A091DNB1_FUKDA|nr:hypothetical protein H920_05998 [Fukomys damarensis]
MGGGSQSLGFEHHTFLVLRRPYFLHPKSLSGAPAYCQGLLPQFVGGQQTGRPYIPQRLEPGAIFGPIVVAAAFPRVSAGSEAATLGPGVRTGTVLFGGNHDTKGAASSGARIVFLLDHFDLFYFSP